MLRENDPKHHKMREVSNSTHTHTHSHSLTHTHTTHMHTHILTHTLTHLHTHIHNTHTHAVHIHILFIVFQSVPLDPQSARKMNEIRSKYVHLDQKLRYIQYSLCIHNNGL